MFSTACVLSGCVSTTPLSAKQKVFVPSFAAPSPVHLHGSGGQWVCFAGFLTTESSVSTLFVCLSLGMDPRSMGRQQRGNGVADPQELVPGLVPQVQSPPPTGCSAND
uniref:Uncharacterized protein n=1 Tax=Eutreptiella gymnastica TaxID=73025 RepID=A0A7S4FYN5_9EUGL